MGEQEETATMAMRAAMQALPPTGAIGTRRSGAHLWLYAVNFGALILLIIGYVFYAEEEFSTFSLTGAMMTTSGSVKGANSTINSIRRDYPPSPPSAPPPSLTHTVKKFITSSAAGMLNMKRECKANTLGYQSMQCPYWNPSASDPLNSAEAVDYRVRYLWKKQHPADCANASYLVKRTVDNIGFGALMRGHYAGPFAGAMRSDRVFILDPETFPYAGCNGTSWTCYFEPLTNCSYEKHVVPLLEAHPGARENWTAWDNPSHTVVHKDNWGSPEYYPSNRILDDLFKPSGQDDLVVGLYLYMMRLNAPTLQRVEDWLQKIIPCDLDPSRTIALPIRASDKCIGKYYIESGFGGETSCPDFDTYMELCEVIRENDPRVDTILLTSEDARFVEARHPYTVASGNRKPWRFILNTLDVMQGSGDRQILGNHTMDDVFMSFFTTMQMQLRGKYYILNCNSNYHGLIRHSVIEGGCGFEPRPVIICMDDQAPRLRICPGWNRDEFDACMDAKLPEEERDSKRQEKERQKKEEEEKKQREQQQEEEKRKKEEEGEEAAAEDKNDTDTDNMINKDIKRRLGLELRRLVSAAEKH